MFKLPHNCTHITRSKVMFKILQTRLQQYVNCELPDVHVGFRKGSRTRDQIANIHWIIKKDSEFQKNIYFCFIDYAKAFDCVDHNKLWKILNEMGIPDHLTFLLRNLYAGQEATVRTGHGTTDWFQIGEGVHQGCILSLSLFNLYTKYIRWNAWLDEAQAGIKIAGRNTNKLRLTDDTTLMAESEEDLKSLLMKVKEENEKVHLKLNIQKTKITAPGPITSWQIDGEAMETMRDFIFGGSKITADGDCSHEIKRHFLFGRKAMTNLDSILKSIYITFPTKVHLVKATAFPVVMYGCESWTVKKAECQRIGAFELWCWKRLLRVPLSARRSNQSILKEVSPEYALEGFMLKLKLQYLFTWDEELTHWKRSWGWERLQAGGEGDHRGWDGWMASPTQWTWVWASSDCWWWTGKPGVLQSMGSQKVGHNWATELNWLVALILVISIYVFSNFTIWISTRFFLFSVFLFISGHLILSLGMLCFLITGYFASKIIEII